MHEVLHVSNFHSSRPQHLFLNRLKHPGEETVLNLQVKPRESSSQMGTESHEAPRGRPLRSHPCREDSVGPSAHPPASHSSMTDGGDEKQSPGAFRRR